MGELGISSDDISKRVMTVKEQIFRKWGAPRSFMVDGNRAIAEILGATTGIDRSVGRRRVVRRPSAEDDH